MERLSGLDASFLYLETPNNHMHVGTLMLARLPDGHAGDYFAAVRAVVDERLHLVKAYRRRLLPVPLDIDHPIWIEDPDFDLDFHIHHIAVPPPGGLAALLDLVGHLHARPLNRARPLWEFYVIEGLASGEVALYAKVHHCAIDGVAGAELMVSLLDLTPAPRVVPPPEQPWRGERAPHDAELMVRAALHGVVQPLAMLRRLPKVLGYALNVGRRALEPGATLPPAPFQAPRTRFNRPITPHRRLAVATVPLARIKAVKAALGVTVNDVVLALCAAMLRRYLDDKDALPDKPLIAFCPISVRTDDQKGQQNNRVSGMLVSLATDIATPLDRLRAIAASTADAKALHKALPADLLRDWSLFAAPLVAAQAARLYARYKIADYHRPPFNVIVSNVPGPGFPLYLAGAEVRHIYPVSIPTDGLAMNITVLSYRDGVEFGITADRDVVPDVDDLLALVGPALDELEASVGGHSRAAVATADSAGPPRSRGRRGASHGRP